MGAGGLVGFITPPVSNRQTAVVWEHCVFGLIYLCSWELDEMKKLRAERKSSSQLNEHPLPPSSKGGAWCTSYSHVFRSQVYIYYI
jgi:hypothetical protein